VQRYTILKIGQQINQLYFYFFHLPSPAPTIKKTNITPRGKIENKFKKYYLTVNALFIVFSEFVPIYSIKSPGSALKLIS
jgi:hypothetical protein